MRRAPGTRRQQRLPVSAFTLGALLSLNLMMETERVPPAWRVHMLGICSLARSMLARLPHVRSLVSRRCMNTYCLEEPERPMRLPLDKLMGLYGTTAYEVPRA
jgi:hypothetical protein